MAKINVCVKGGDVEGEKGGGQWWWYICAWMKRGGEENLSGIISITLCMCVGNKCVRRLEGEI